MFQKNLATIRFTILGSSLLLPKSVKIKTYKPIIMPVVLNGREMWYLAQREDRNLKTIGQVLRRIVGSK